MIKLNYVPNRLTEEGRELTNVPYEPGTLVRSLLPPDTDPEEYVLIVGGRVIEDLEEQVLDGETYVLTPRVGVEAIAAAVAWVVANWVYVYAAMVVLSIGYAIYAANNVPRAPNQNTDGDGIDENSATYGWDGIRLTQEVGGPVGLVIGRHRRGGNIIGAYVRSEGDKNYLNLLIAIGEGPVNSVSDILINDNPIENFDNVTYEVRYGTNDQSVVAGFEDSHNLYSVNVNLNTINDSHTYTTADSDVQGYIGHIMIPSLFQQSGADLIAWSVTYTVEHRLTSVGGAFFLAKTVTITEKTNTAVRRTFEVTGLDADQYDIRVTRTSATPSLDPQKQGDLTWVQIDELKYGDGFTYPNTALLKIEALATDQLSGSLPNITHVQEGILCDVPKIMQSGSEIDWEDYYWDPDTEQWRLFEDDTVCTWDGSTFVERWNACPIWQVKNILTSKRWGAGNSISTEHLNSTKYLEMAKYCEERVPDGNGGYEKRFRLDIVLDSSTNAMDMLGQISASFRACMYYSGKTIHYDVDRPKTSTQTFHMGNIVQNSFKMSWSKLSSAPNIVEVQFMNKDLNYEQDVVAYRDEVALRNNEPPRKLTRKVFVTSKSAALREARYAVLVGKYITRSGSFQSGIQAVVCQASNHVRVQHDVPQWGYGGRVKAGSTTTSVVLDREVTVVTGKTYKLRVQFNDDSVEEKTVSSVAGDYTTLEVVGDPFTSAPGEYDSWVFGENTKVGKDFRILSIRRSLHNDVELQVSEYNENVYDDSEIDLPVDNYSALDSDLPDVRDLTVTEIMLAGDKSALEVEWNRPDDAANTHTYRGAEVWMSADGTNYYLEGYTELTKYRVTVGVATGETFYVKVLTCTTLNMKQKLSDVSAVSVLVDGQESSSTPVTPADVTDFAASFGKELTLSWSANEEASLSAYEIRTENANWGTENSAQIYFGLNTSFSFTPSASSGITYYIRAKTSGGLYSDTAASITPSNSAPEAPTGLSTLANFNMMYLVWNPVSDTDIIHYDIYSSEIDAWAGEEEFVGRSVGASYAIQGHEPDYGKLTAVTSDTVFTCSDLIGADIVGDKIVILSGSAEDDERTISAFNSTTGEITVSSALTETPAVDDSFHIKDVKYFKVRAVDPYQNGAFSTSAVGTYAFITEGMMGKGIIQKEHLYTGELITLSAQIANAIISNAHILDLAVTKLTGGTITSAEIILGSGGTFESENYVQGSTGFKLTDSSFDFHTGAMNANVVLVAGSTLQEQFEVTEQNTVHDEDTEWEGTGYAVSNVTVNASSITLDAGETAGTYDSPPIEVNGATMGVLQWIEAHSAYISTPVSQSLGTSAYTCGYSGGTVVGNDTNVFDGNTGTTASWVDGTTKWGQYSFAEVDLGSEVAIQRIRVYGNSHCSWGYYIDYSSDGTNWTNLQYSTTTGWYTLLLSSSVTARYWRFRSRAFQEYHDGPLPYEFQLFQAATTDVTFQTRTADNSSMTSATAWSTALTNPLGSQINNDDPDTYIQYRINLTREASAEGTVSVTWVKVNYDIVVAKNANKVGGYEASATPTANKIPVLDSSGLVPTAALTAVINQACLKTSTGEVNTSGSTGTYIGCAVLMRGAGSGSGLSVENYAVRANASCPSSYTSSISMVRSYQISGEPTTYASGETHLTLPGGTYGFYPQIKLSSSTVYAQQRYVTASGRDHWIFLLIAKKDVTVDAVLIHRKGDVVASYQAPDHPSTNNGCTHLEITHPFENADLEIYEVVLVDNTFLTEARNNVRRSRSLLQVITEDYVLDDSKRPKYTEREIVYIDEYDEDVENVEEITRIKTPQWAHIVIGKEEVSLKRTLVYKLPTNLNFKSLRKRR